MICNLTNEGEGVQWETDNSWGMCQGVPEHGEAAVMVPRPCRFAEAAQPGFWHS